jgi:hypothetical protein
MADETVPSPASESRALAWWYGARVRRYNILMFMVGLASYTALFSRLFHEETVTGLFLVPEFLLHGFFVGSAWMILTNFGYLVGPLLDLLVPAALKRGYREWCYRLGCGFATACLALFTVAGLLAPR